MWLRSWWRYSTGILTISLVCSCLVSFLGESAITGDGFDSVFTIPIARLNGENIPPAPAPVDTIPGVVSANARSSSQTSAGFNFLWLVLSRIGGKNQHQEGGLRRQPPHYRTLHNGVRLNSNLPRATLQHLRRMYPGLLSRKKASTSHPDASRSQMMQKRLLDKILTGQHIGFEMEFYVTSDSGSGYLITGHSVDDIRYATNPLSTSSNSIRRDFDIGDSRDDFTGRDSVSSRPDNDISPTWFGLHIHVEERNFLLRIEYRSLAWNSGQKVVVNLNENPFAFGDWIKLSVRIDFETNSAEYWLNCNHVHVKPAERDRPITNTYFNFFRLVQHKRQSVRPVQVTFRSVIITDGRTPDPPKQCFSTAPLSDECTGGRVFMECGPSCQLTCEDKQSSRDCSAACVRGCHCPAGTVLGRRSCVEIRDCPCRIGAMYYAAASQVTINNEICNCVAGGWKCHAIAQLIRSPANRTVMIGKNTTLTCSVGGNPLPVLTWLAPAGASYRIELSSGNRLSRLLISNATANETGTYTCTARRDVDGWSANASANVDVTAPPMITSLPKTVPIILGTQTFSIDCVVSGLPEPSVAWVKLKSRFPANAERYAAAPGVFRLRFHKGLFALFNRSVWPQVQPSDAGEYRCYAFNQAGRAKKSVYVLVNLPPPRSESFKRPPIDRRVKRGRKAVFPCQIIDHNVLTNVTWYKDKQLLPIDNRKFIQKKHKLIIRRVTPKDAGTYACIVTLPTNEKMHAKARLMIRGRMLPWSQWSRCSVSCGKGRKIRRRTCTGIPPNPKTCRGKFLATRRCNLQVCPGICSSYGDPNYSTFDGYKFNFQGDCGYILAKDVETKEFEIVQYNVGCGSHLSCVNKVTAILTYPLLSAFVELGKDRSVLVNGVQVQLPYVSSNKVLTIANIGLFVVLRAGNSLEIRWAIPHRLYVVVSGKYAGKTLGLCGNFNGRSEDDRQTPNRNITRSDLAFGQSWSHTEGSTNYSCLEIQSQSDPCARDPVRGRQAEEICSFLRESRFAACRDAVNPRRFIETCKSDICSSPMEETDVYYCTALAAYSEECLRHDIELNWRAPDVCPVQCSGRKTYSECGPSCVRHCPALAKNGTICVSHNRCLPGCYCPDDLVLHNGSCIPVSECPCDFSGMLFAPGQLHHRNCQRCICAQGAWKCVFNSLLCNYPASVVKGPTSQVAQYGNPVTFCCEVVGIPTPEVQWYKNGQRLQLTGSGSKQTSTNASHDDLNATLHLRNVSMNDIGVYSCKAANNLGSHKSNQARLAVIDPDMTSCDANPSRNFVQLPEGCFVTSNSGNHYVGVTAIDLGKCSGDPCYSQSSQVESNQCRLARHCCQPSVTRPVLVRCRHSLYNTSFHITVIEQCACVACTNHATVVEGVVKEADKGLPVKFVKISHRGRTLGYTSRSGSFQLSLNNLPPETERVTLTFSDVVLKRFTTTIKSLLILPGQSTIHTVTMYPCNVQRRFHALRGLRFIHRPVMGSRYWMRLIIPPGSLISDRHSAPYKDVVTARISFVNAFHFKKRSGNHENLARNSMSISLTGEEQIFSLSAALCVTLYSRTGRPLNLIPGRFATVIMTSSSVDSKLQSWMLDDVTGYWREHKERLEVVPRYTKAGRKELLLKAKIKRFNSFWALGSSRTPCYLRSQVLDAQDNPVPGIRLVFTTHSSKKRMLPASRRSQPATGRRTSPLGYYVDGLTRDKGHSNGICLPVGCHDVGLLYASRLGNDLVLLDPEEPAQNMGMIRRFPVTRRYGRRRHTVTSNVLDTTSPYNATGLASHFAYFPTKDECTTTPPEFHTYIFRDYSDLNKKNVLSRIRYNFNNRVIQTFAMTGTDAKHNPPAGDELQKFCYVKVLIRFHSSTAYEPRSTNVLESLTFRNKTEGGSGMTVLGWRRVVVKQPTPMDFIGAVDHTEVVCIEYVCGASDSVDSDDLVVYLSLRRSRDSDGSAVDNLSERSNCNFTTYLPPPLRLARRASRLSARSFGQVTFNRGGYVYVSGRAREDARQEQSQFKLTHHEMFRHVFEGRTREISKRKCESTTKHQFISAYFECW